jgi:hypothetical protein
LDGDLDRPLLTGTQNLLQPDTLAESQINELPFENFL